MRTLSATLAAAQKGLQGLAPVIKLDISDRPVEVPRWDWSSTSSEGVSSCHGAAALTNGGAVVRIRVKTTGQAQTARIATPGTDNWATAWADLKAGCSTSAQASIGAATDSATVIIAYVSGDNLTLYYRISTDGGATYGAEQTFETVVAPETIKGVALCGGAGYVYLAYTVDSGAAEPNDTLKVDRYGVSGAAWAGTVTDAGHDTITGCGVAVDSNVQRVVMGGDLGLKRRDYDWGGAAWQTAVSLLALASGAGYALSYPRLCKSPDGSGRWYYTFLEEWTVDVAGSRQWVYCTPDKDELYEGLIFDTNRGKGWDLLYTASYWYMTSPVTHYRCVPYSGSASQRKDVGADVVAFDLEEDGENRPTRGRIWLRNEDGRYASPGSGTYAMIREGARVCLGLGYTTSAGSESVWLPPLWVEGWAHVEANTGEAYLVLDVGDAWSYLERCRARQQVSYSGLTLGAVAARQLKRVGSTAIAESGGLDITADSFTLKPGDSVGATLRRVFERAGVVVRFGTTAVSSDPGHWDACVPSVQVKGSGASGYSFGSGEHPVLRAQYEDRRQPYNLIEIYGKAYLDQRRDLQHMKDAGHLFRQQEADWHLDSSGDVGDRRDRLYYDAQLRLKGGWIECLPHVGAEIYDVVDVTASRAGLSAAVRRVLGIRWRFDGRKGGVWLQRLELGAV